MTPPPTEDGTDRKSLDERVQGVREMRGTPGSGSGDLPDGLGERPQNIPTTGNSLLSTLKSQPKTVSVCWQCEKYWMDDEYEYCPLCSADLVEVEEA